MLAPCWTDEFGALEEVSQVSCQVVTKQQVQEFKAESQLEPRPARGQGTRDEETLTHVDGLRFEQFRLGAEKAARREALGTRAHSSSCSKARNPGSPPASLSEVTLTDLLSFSST